MTRQEISAELNRVASEWRVPLSRLRGTRNREGQPGALQIAARATFVRRMLAEGVEAGHVAWALNISETSARRWYQKFRAAEKAWWQHEVS